MATLLCYDKFSKLDESAREKQNKPKEQKNCCIVEGINDALFVEKILFGMNVGCTSDNTILYASEGKDNLGLFLRGFAKSPLFTRGAVKNIAVCFDADDNASESRKAIVNALNTYMPNFNLTADCTIEKAEHYRVGVFLFPDDARSGILETLCIDLIGEDNSGAEVLKRCDCLNLPPDHYEKRLMQVFLATPPGDFCSGVGMGMKKGLLPERGAALKKLETFFGNCLGFYTDLKSKA